MESIRSVHGTSVQNITEYKELPFFKQSYVDSISSLKLSQQTAKPEESCLRKFWNAIVTFFNWIYCCSCCYYKKEDGSTSTTTDTTKTSSSTTPGSSKDITTDSSDNSSSESLTSPTRSKESKKGEPLNQVINYITEHYSQRRKDNEMIHSYLKINREKEETYEVKKPGNIAALLKKAITTQPESEISLIFIFRNLGKRGEHVCEIRDHVKVEKWTVNVDNEFNVSTGESMDYSFSLTDNTKDKFASTLSKMNISQADEIARKLFEKANREHQNSIKKKDKKLKG